MIAVVSQPYDIEFVRVDIGTSIGVAMSPIDGVLADELLKNADTARYHAKSAGRGLHSFYAGHMNAEIRRRRALAADLREAFKSDQLESHDVTLAEQHVAT